MLKEKVVEIIAKWHGEKEPCAVCLKIAGDIDNLFKAEVEKLTVIGDEEIYKLNDAKTEERKHIFREAGFLDGSRANMEAQLQHTKKQLLSEL